MADNQKMIYITKGHHSVKTECRVIALIFCIPSDVASYLFKHYEFFLTVQSFRTGIIFILNIHKENNSEKIMVGSWFLFSAYCPMLYIWSKFHENIDDRFNVIEWIRF